MEILVVPFNFDREEFNRRVKIELYEGMEDEIESLLDKAVPLIRPKAVYRELEIMSRESQGQTGQRHGNSSMESSLNNLQIDDQVFTDSILVNRLRDVSTVFPYIITCGIELEELAKGDDMLAEFWLDALKQMALDRAFNYFRIHIKEKCNISKLYSLNPGSSTCGEGWDISDQKKLFSFFPSVEEKLGIRLTESMLMFPNKTLSGIMFESDRDFVSCQECDNIHCPNRKIIHEGAVLSS